MTALDLPEQVLHLSLAGGRIQRPGDPASPAYRGTLDSSMGAIAIELLIEPGSLYDPRGLVAIDGSLGLADGQKASEAWPDLEVETMAETAIREFRIDVEEQQVELLPLPAKEATAYRVPVIVGKMTSSIGDWSVTYIDGSVYLSIGWGAYR